ncbi:SDR family NAD(P)-dependent oxidoreductase [Nocardiopsis sp. NRRL B-16309]|uniref:SDR family NAD(P)-dependent oxidoreductase n=1 Tax=Nocardiopsis sp. NRRL B-16309 TaxID=1519494 RepID=UPI0006AFAAE9|nr:SDR family oxidoreductase [Nocardiopsis sp. NRRL B-16309]KOX12617.1 short-chain dehydrogenase [Nocardiopsis sp. NRRL B-16309]
MSRTALVTGGTRGIGRAIALALAEDGASLVGVQYRGDEESAALTARLIEEREATAVTIRADFGTDPLHGVDTTAREFLKAVEELTGRREVDVLVNNAGIAAPQPLGQIDASTYRQVMDVNLTAPLFLIQELAPCIAQDGRIVNVSTGYTRIAAPTHPVYSASKAALNALTLALAPTLGPRGITVNAVMPGVIDTDMNAEWLSEPGAREYAEGLSVFKRVGEVDDVAGLVRYLASPQARWTTGQVIDATGGSAL